MRELNANEIAAVAGGSASPIAIGAPGSDPGNAQALQDLLQALALGLPSTQLPSIAVLPAPGTGESPTVVTTYRDGRDGGS